MYPFIIIHDIIPIFLEEYSRGCTYFNQNFCQYLLQLTIGNPQNNQENNLNKIPKSYSIEQYIKNALRKRDPDKKHETKFFITIEELVPYFLKECSRNFLHIDPCFVNYFLHLLIHDAQDGLQLNVNSNNFSVCKIEQFLQRALAKLRNSLDATLCNMKMSYFFKHRREISIDFVKQKYEVNFSEKLEVLINSILQYPETSSQKQLDDMFIKMQIFIITNFYIGCPKNDALLNECRQSLNSILVKGDIQKYVLKKRYHRMEYLQKLGATAAGILIFNNQAAKSDKEYMRDIFADLNMAQSNTKDSLEEGINHAGHLIKMGFNIIQKLIKINVIEKNVHYLRSLTEVHELNKFVILFEGYRYNLQQLKEVFGKTQYLIEVSQRNFICVVDKINEILKYRSAIESKLIFPHFVYLSEIWTSLVLYLNYLVEINKIKDHLSDFINEDVENKFFQLLEQLSTENNHLKHPMNYLFEELMNLENKHDSNLNFLNMKPFIKNYCALTIVLTGILVPSKLEKKLCENSEFYFGFVNMEYAKYAERNFKDFLQVFCNAILASSDLLLLFQLDECIMRQSYDLINQSKTKTKTLEAQTEMYLSNNDLSPSKQINSTWNVWDFHRQTIKLANIRQKQTQSTQSKLSYGIRNAQNQFYSNLKCNNGSQK